MLMVNCPWCGFRDETEFKYGGQANIVRPGKPEMASDSDWANYLYIHLVQMKAKTMKRNAQTHRSR